MELEKANYIGNKERFAEYIVEKFLDGGKTIFDPMCFPAGTLIFCRNGFKPIETIAIGDEVLTASGAFHKVLQTFQNEYNGELIRIKAPYCLTPILATPNHPVAVLNEESVEYIPAEQITTEHRLIFPKPKAGTSDLESIEIYNKPLYRNCTPIPQHVPLSEDFLTLCGMYLADGFTDGNMIYFSNLWNAKRLGKLLRSVFWLTPSYIDIESDFKGKKYPSCRVRAASRPLVRFFISQFGRRAENKIIPDWIFNLPNEKLAIVLREYWRADGSLSARKERNSQSFQLGTTSKALAGQLKILFARFGMLLSMDVCNENYLRLKTECSSQINQVCKLFGMSEMIETNNASNGKLKETNDYFTYKPSSIEREPYQGAVYNLNVDHDHTYVTAGFSVHNCGCSAVLREAARKGYTVIGNDLSILPLWYSKGVFEGTALSDDEVEKLLNAEPVSGWLTEEWKGMYPRVKEIRKFIDGLVVSTGKFQGGKQLTAKAVASRLLQTLYSDSGSGFSTRNWETIPDVKRVLGKSIKEVNSLINEVGGKGKIISGDARTMEFPKVDVVYFDPPFFPKDKGPVKYFQSYKVPNSVLLQKEWREENLKPEEIPAILKKLCECSKQIFISTERNSQIPYTSELQKYKQAVKKFKLEYRQTSGFPAGRSEQQLENLLFGKRGAQ